MFRWRLSAVDRQVTLLLLARYSCGLLKPVLKALLPGCRGGMGNIMEGTRGHGEASRTGQPGGGVHGVLHRLKPLDLARLTHMEHEYRSAQILTTPDSAC